MWEGVCCVMELAEVAFNTWKKVEEQEEQEQEAIQKVGDDIPHLFDDLSWDGDVDASDDKKVGVEVDAAVTRRLIMKLIPH